VDAGFLDAADVHVVGVEEFHDDDAEEILIGDGFGDVDEGEAAEELFQREGGAGGGVAGGEGGEEAVAEGLVLFVDDGAAFGLEEDFLGDHVG
jgi:hypothetical protein